MPPSRTSPRVATSASEPDRPPCTLAAALLAQARRWLDHTRGHLDPDYAARKLVEALDFSARCTQPAPCVRLCEGSMRPSTCLAGTCGKAACLASYEAFEPPSFALPSKLVRVATAERQDVLRRLAGVPGGLRLHLVRYGPIDAPERIVVYAPRPAFDREAGDAEIGSGLGAGFDPLDLGIPLGEVQPKHVGWLSPLVGRGVWAVLLQVTGGRPDRPTLGCNVALAGLDPAIRAVSSHAGRASRRAA